MADSRRNLASPTSIKGSMPKKHIQSDLKQKIRSLKGKENQIHQETPKKPIPTKHFMSPTFSASCKARKKLSLIQTNQEEEHNSVTFSKNENLASPRYPLSPITLGSKPYDPLTNYLTPRPKFILYNPDKQRDNLEEMGLIGSQDFDEMPSSECSSSSLSLPQPEFVKEESVESSDFEDDGSEEKHGMLYRVMKLLLVLCAIIVSTLYVASMNSPKNGHLLSLQGYGMIRGRRVQDPVDGFALGSVFLNQTLGKEPSESVTMEKSRTVFDQIHLSDEGEVAVEISDLLQVSVNVNVVRQVLEDSSKYFDPPDLVEELSDEGEVARETSDLLQISVNENVVRQVLADSSKLFDPSDITEKLSDEGEVAIETPDLLHVSVNENVVGQVLEDSSKLFDPSDMTEKTEIDAETLRIPYVSDIQGLPISTESTGEEVLFDEKVTACEGTGEEETVSEQQVETAVNMFDATGATTNLQDVEIVKKIDSSGEPGNVEALPYMIDQPRVVLGYSLSTGEVVDSVRGLCDDHITRTEAMVTDVVLPLGGTASLVAGIALLTITLTLVWRVFSKPSERVPSPVIQEYVEPVLEEDYSDLTLANKGESTEEKEQFSVEQRLIELCHFRAPTVELLGEYMVIPGFSRSSLENYTYESSPVEAQQMKQGILPDSPSISSRCSNTSLDSNQRYNQDKIVWKEEASTTAHRHSNRIRKKTDSCLL